MMFKVPLNPNFFMDLSKFTEITFLLVLEEYLCWNVQEPVILQLRINLNSMA